MAKLCILFLVFLVSVVRSQTSDYVATSTANCDAVSPNDIKPPANASPILTANMQGLRVYECFANQTVNPRSSAEALTISTLPDGWSGGFYYGDNDTIAVFNFTNGDHELNFTARAVGGAALEEPKDGSLPWGRFLIHSFDTNYDTDGLLAAYITRTDSTGGGVPKDCPAGATDIQLPFTAVYKLWVCGDVAVEATAAESPASGSASCGTIAGLLMIVGALLFA